jgi:hypothetical protein
MLKKLLTLIKSVMFLPIMSMASSNYFVVHLFLVKLKVFVVFVDFVFLACLLGCLFVLS